MFLQFTSPKQIKCLKVYYPDSEYQTLKVGKAYTAIGQTDSECEYYVEVNGKVEIHDKCKFEVM